MRFFPPFLFGLMFLSELCGAIGCLLLAGCFQMVLSDFFDVTDTGNLLHEAAELASGGHAA